MAVQLSEARPNIGKIVVSKEMKFRLRRVMETFGKIIIPKDLIQWKSCSQSLFYVIGSKDVF